MASSHPTSVSFPSRQGLSCRCQTSFPRFWTKDDPNLNQKGSTQQAEIADSITKLFVGVRFVGTQNNIEWQGLGLNRILPWSARIDLFRMYKLTGKRVAERAGELFSSCRVQYVLTTSEEEFFDNLRFFNKLALFRCECVFGLVIEVEF